MIEEARLLGKKRLFALSIEPRMWEFFEELGFHRVDRNTLPEEWQRSYDFSRPSKAFLLAL
jgi:N-acetylglutamate synthase-like GNAT family acetyltransferase